MQSIVISNRQREGVKIGSHEHQSIPVSNPYNITVITPSAPTYEGEYTVSPDFEGTVLETEGKIMSDDVTVEPIEVSRVSNPSGGKTVYIGGIINA